MILCAFVVGEETEVRIILLACWCVLDPLSLCSPEGAAALKSYSFVEPVASMWRRGTFIGVFHRSAKFGCGYHIRRSGAASKGEGRGPIGMLGGIHGRQRQRPQVTGGSGNGGDTDRDEEVGASGRMWGTREGDELGEAAQNSSSGHGHHNSNCRNHSSCTKSMALRKDTSRR